MSKTPDRSPGVLQEDEEIQLGSNPGTPSQAGALRYDGTLGAFQLRDAVGTFDPRSGSGLSAAQHAALLQLIHFIDEGPAESFASGATKTTTGTVFPTEELWKRADNTALVRKSITWVGATPMSVVWRVYDVDGVTVLATITDTITYTGPFESSRVRAVA